MSDAVQTSPRATDVDQDRLGECVVVGQVLRVTGGFLLEWVQA
jgi:hypothetical protein